MWKRKEKGRRTRVKIGRSKTDSNDGILEDSAF
jgi:hypothetical protein